MKRKKILIFALMVAIIVAHYTSLLKPMENLWINFAGGISTPVFKLTQKITFWHGWQEKNELQKKIEKLEKQNYDITIIKSRLTELERENTELKSALNWSKNGTYNYIIGKVTGHPLNLPNTYYLINRGAKDGLIEGLPVIIGENVIIGRITNTRENDSIFQLITDNQSSLSVRLADSQEPIGVVNGQLGLTLKLELVPATLEIKENDIILTSGQDENIPNGLIIGTIDSINEKTSDFFQSAIVNTAYQLNQIYIVSVITQ